jgi:hypothetical protein
MSELRTFASDVTPWPTRRDDWEACARLAGDLLEQRQKLYPSLVERDKLTADQAERGLRVMGAIVKLWQIVLACEDLPGPADCEPRLGATLADMQREIAGSRERLRQLADRPEAGSDDRRNAEVGEALWWHLQPTSEGAPPHIWIPHGLAQWQRSRPKRGRAA